MKIEAKNLVVTAALVLLGSLVVASTTYYVMNQNFEKERATFNEELRNTDVVEKKTTSSSGSTTISVNDSTTNWINYTNSTYGYSIKYPNGWVVKDYGDPKFPLVAFADGQANLPASTSEGVPQIGIRVNGLAYTKADLAGTENADKVTEETVTVAGTTATKFTKLPGRVNDVLPDTRMVFYQVKTSSNKYLFISATNDTNIATLEKMIQTLKLS